MYSPSYTYFNKKNLQLKINSKLQVKLLTGILNIGGVIKK